MSEAADPVRVAVTIIVCGMSFIVLGGAVTFAILSPETVTELRAAIEEGDDRGGIWLWGAQAVTFATVALGLLAYVWRRPR